MATRGNQRSSAIDEFEESTRELDGRQLLEPDDTITSDQPSYGGWMNRDLSETIDTTYDW